jgi:hypothetical protein
MNHSFSVALVLLAALLAANLPFINERLIAVFPRRSPKSLWLRVGELIVCYFLVGALGLALEQSAGQIYPQGWEFYATTGALFLTLAFPGFVYRYLFKRKG